MNPRLFSAIVLKNEKKIKKSCCFYVDRVIRYEQKQEINAFVKVYFYEQLVELNKETVNKGN